MKYLILKNESDLDDIIKFLIDEIGLPKIQKRLNIYSVDDDLQIEILNNKVYFKDNSRNKFNFIKNKNLKQFFKYIQSKNKNGFLINDIVLLDFVNIEVLFNTFHGNILSTEDEELVAKLTKSFSFEIYDNINNHDELFTIKPEFLFDEIGNLNKKIKAYSYQTGLDIRSSSSSVKLRLSNISNDYSYIEKYYKIVTGNELLSLVSSNNYLNKFKNISIVIPDYNTDVSSTLYAIQGQNLSKEEKRKIQVIIIDDGSSKSINMNIKEIKKEVDYEINVITLSDNMGLSNARNVGLALAKYDLILFIDSDIVLSKNYIYDINMRLQIVPNAIFVAMRKNINSDSYLLNKSNLLNGIDMTFELDDSRITTKAKEYHVGWDKAFDGEIISILDDTNYFKQLGFGSKVGIYDLPGVVTGHNIAVNRSKIVRYPAFSTKFKGWGMEDSYFAASLIADGCFVIPVLSSCVYHINHPPRSGSMKKKSEEAKNNFELYNSMLNEKWEER